jgi:myo-inositol-1(or 4)-monophosphatase
MRSPASLSADKLLACAVEAARAAGGHALRNWRRRNEVLRTFAHDVKLALDVECQAIAERHILRRFPDHIIRGEESPEERTATPPAAAPEWIIDPIDGTVNYSHGLPFWCCSIAVRQGGSVQAGAVYAPAMKELFTATRDGPALFNGTPIRVSRTAQLADSVIMTGLDKHLDPRIPPFAVFKAMSARVQKARVVGVAALDMCRVGSGQADGYFENGIYLWDIAAADLIVRRAGGKVTILDLHHGGRLRCIATNGRIHGALGALITRALRAGRRSKA